MNMPQEQRKRNASPVEALRERPWLFLAVAASLLAGTTLVAEELMTPSSMETRVRTEFIVLVNDATTPGSLIRPVPANLDSLRAMISEVTSSDEDTTEGPPETDGLDIAHDLKVENGDKKGEVIFSMDGDIAPRSIDQANMLISKIVDRLNQQRTVQRDEVLALIEKASLAWQTRVDEAKRAIVKNPFDPDLVKNEGQPGDEELLRLMIGAIGKAQTEGRGDDTDLGSDVTRLQNVLAELEAGLAAQLEHGRDLRDAEAGLAKHAEEAAMLTTDGGILDRPAAVIEEAASAELVTGLARHAQSFGWPAIILALATLSLVPALIAAMAVHTRLPGADVASNVYLNDPHWPLPPGARQEFST